LPGVLRHYPASIMTNVTIYPVEFAMDSTDSMQNSDQGSKQKRRYSGRVAFPKRAMLLW
jgi:hypothetical protein